MRRLFLLFFGAVLLGGCVTGNNEKLADPSQAAVTAVTNMANGDFKSLMRSFDPVMQIAAPEKMMKEAWEKNATKPYGQFQSVVTQESKTIKGFEVYRVTCRFEKGYLIVQITFNKKNQISGLYFFPAPASLAVSLPAYVKRDSFEEKEIQIGDDEWKLPGSLCLPKGKKKSPLVIFVHGSGPSDRDETVGPNRPFRDMAWGLSSAGIATLRYDKRTFVYGAKIKSQQDFTAREETVDDVLRALSLCREWEEIDPRRVFVAGHSFGGMMMPRIAGLIYSNTNNLVVPAGYILLAGTPRHLEDLLLYQVGYLIGLDGETNATEGMNYTVLKKQIQVLKESKLTRLTPAGKLPLGLSPAYWRYLRDYDICREAGKISQPVLVLQGERDYQVTMTDFQMWRDCFSGKKNVRYRSYPGLNHLFIFGEGKSSPDEYQTPGSVDGEVIRDMVEFVRGTKP